jgi:uncharacterized protein YndB with AHSA1/START domain
MTVHLRVATTVPVPPDDLWRAIERIETHTDWMADAESITFCSAQTSGVGATFRCRTRVGPVVLDDAMRVTEWDAPRVMGIAHEGVVTGTGRFTLSPSAAGTRLVWDERLVFPWFLGGRVGERIGRVALAHIWRGNLRRLRRSVTR